MMYESASVHGHPQALANEKRVRVLLALRGGGLCVCQITELFGLAPSAISKHLFILHQAERVESRKDGRADCRGLPVVAPSAPSARQETVSVRQNPGSSA